MNTKNEWSNDQVLEFIDLYRLEEPLWDPTNQYHKNKNVLAASWERIRKMMCMENLTVTDLKKKKESLMTTYRFHLKKLKNSLEGGDEIYQTNWFAYERLNSFLGQNYDCKGLIYTENKEEPNETSYYIHTEPELHQQQSKRKRTKKQETTVHQEQKKRQKMHNVQNFELQQIKKHMDNAYEVMTVAANRQNFDETDHFCHMLAKKLKKMNESDRDKLMYEIHALTYQAIYSSRPSSPLSSSSDTTYIDPLQTHTSLNIEMSND